MIAVTGARGALGGRVARLLGVEQHIRSDNPGSYTHVARG